MQAKKTSMVFTGDIGFDRYMDKRWEDKKLLSSRCWTFFTVPIIQWPMWKAR